MKDDDKTEFVTALARGLAVIKAFGRDARELTLTDVAKRAGLARATSRRLLMTLETLGYVRSDGRQFALTPRVMELGYTYLSSQPLAERALPVMKRLVDELGESCSMSVLDGTDIVYIARVPPKHLMTIPVNVGSRLPAYVTSTGRILLAALPPEAAQKVLAESNFKKHTSHTATARELPRILRDVAAQGYALCDQELEEGLRSLAVPVRDRAGNVIAGLNISVHTLRATKADMVRRHLPALRKAAAEISGLA